ncbi:hypothetical protein [Tepidiforma sp.]|uniref:hypothetical protein n=1 Tax=Tepidiforma sp. TaxID=2682230 RepID=UPI002ADD951F|nr:hypothetical protein [Tepidiforma sp.]
MTTSLVIVAILAAVNPFVAASAAGPRAVPLRVVLSGTALSIAAYSLMAAFAGEIVDWLGVEPESFRLAAGIVMAVSGAATIVLGAPARSVDWHHPLADLFPLGVPLLLSPAGMAAVVTTAASEGAPGTVAVVLAVLAAAALLLLGRAGRAGHAMDGLARLLAGILVAIGVALGIDGIRSV